MGKDTAWTIRDWIDLFEGMAEDVNTELRVRMLDNPDDENPRQTQLRFGFASSGAKPYAELWLESVDPEPEEG